LESRGLHISETYGFHYERVRALDVLAELERERGDFELAFDFARRAREAERAASQASAKTQLRYHQVLLDVERVEERSRELVRANQRLHTANARLAEANREIREIVGIAAHDLRNPLFGVVAEAELALMTLDELSSEEIREHFQYIVEAGQRLSETLDDLLETSALDEGARDLDLSPCDGAEILEEVVRMHRGRARQKSMELVVEVRESGLVLADATALHELLANIVSNALKFTPPGGGVRAVYGVDPGDASRMVLSVSDDGPGISASDQERLFGKFQRLTARPTGSEHSTGLGLYIVRKLVEAMHGEVWCVSELGEGATFHVSLPRS